MYSHTLSNDTYKYTNMDARADETYFKPITKVT
jgi:hypothetical protein